MTLRRRVLLTIGAIGLILIVALYALSSTILMQSFAQLEERDVLLSVQRAQDSLANDLSTMDIVAHDWASWNETYSYATGQNPSYEEDNLYAQTLVNLRLNLLMIVDTSAEVRYGTGCDLESQRLLPAPAGIAPYLSPGSYLLQSAPLDRGRTGLIMLEEGLLLVAARPILTNEETGPSPGTLVMGRYFDAGEVQRLSELAGSPVQLRRVDDPTLAHDFLTAQSALTEQEPVLVQPLGIDSVAGYILLRDINGTPIAMLRVDRPRTLVQQGQTVVLYLFISLLTVTLLFGAAIVWIVERSVLRRLTDLSTQVSQVRTSGDVSRRVTVAGEDELAALGHNINGMIAAMGAALAERQESARSLQRRNSELEALRQASLGLTSRLELQPVLEAILDHTLKLVEADNAHIFLYDGQRAIFGAALWKDGRREQPQCAPQSDGFTYAVANGGQRIVVPAVSEHPLYHSTAWGEAMVGLPLRRGERVLGVMNVALDRPHQFDMEELRVLELLADQAAVAVENAQLYSSVQQQMEQLKSTQAQLVQSARLVAVGELAAGVAHELNNSLTPILGFTALLLEEMPTDSPYRPDLVKITAKARQASEIVRNLLDFARQMKPQKQVVHINDVLRQTVALVRAHLEKSGMELVEEYGQDLESLSVDVGQMGQVFLNLINNAAQAMPQGGELRLRTYREGTGVAIAISDTGEGMLPEVQARIFEPFFTTRAERAGLGLAVSLGIVQEHGGRISVESEPRCGSTFTVWLPM